MQKKQRSVFRTDLRPALIASAIIGLALLAAFTLISFLVKENLPLYGAVLLGV